MYNSPRDACSSRYDAFLFDLDGVLYRGDEPIPSAAEAMRVIRAAGKRVAFVTNNASATPDAVVGRLRRVGVEARRRRVETSALTDRRPAGSLAGSDAVVVIGEAGLLEAAPWRRGPDRPMRRR